MRTLVYHVAVSLDNTIAHNDGTFDYFAMEGDHVDAYIKSLEAYDTVIMGRKTYEVALKFNQAPYPGKRAIVYSKSLTTTPFDNVTMVASDPLDHVRHVKAEGTGPIKLAGGGQLAGSLLTAGLIDQLRLKLNPVLGGTGIPLFAGLSEVQPLHLDHVTRFDSGVIELTYAVG